MRPASLSTHIKAAIWLWFYGLRDAVCLHRCVIFFVHDPTILSKVAQCFLLNGAVFLGSILVLQHAVSPAVHLLLHAAFDGRASAGTIGALDAVLRATYTWLWLMPAYAISLLVNCVWYQDIAEAAFKVLQGRSAASAGRQRRVAVAQPQPWNLHVGQEVHRVVLFNVFLAQTLAVRLVPLIGPLLYFFMLSWLYAFYWHDYKWSLTKHPVASRLHLFQSHWAFFAGFGSLCILPQLVFPFLLSEAIMGMAFPLFVLVACNSDPRPAHAAGISHIRLLAG